MDRLLLTYYFSIFMFLNFSPGQLLAVALVFVWTGFVRTGLGFGGAALGLPLMLFIDNNPLLWLPIIGVHLLFFSGLTLLNRLHNVDWQYLRRSAGFIIPAAIVGVFGLISLPLLWLNTLIYSITLFYGFIWLLNRGIESRNVWIDRVLLVLGGYIAGISLTGAPLMVAVYMRNVGRHQLRDTLFVLWFILVSIKMTTFVVLSVNLHFLTALSLLPIAAIGHVAGLKTHDRITRNDLLFKRWIGGGLMIVSLLGLWELYGKSFHSNLTPLWNALKDAIEF